MVLDMMSFLSTQKYISQDRIHVTHHNPTTNQQMIFMLKLATFSSSYVVIMDLISWQNIQSKLTLVKHFLMLLEDLQS